MASKLKISNLKFIIDIYQEIMDKTKNENTFMWALKEQGYYKRILAKITNSNRSKTAERSENDR